MKQLEFFNTINLNGNDLKKSIMKAESQGNRILGIMSDLQVAVTPAEVHQIYTGIFNDVPITSIRRAITNLTNLGYLKKTEFKAVGNYGAINYKWIVASSVSFVGEKLDISE